MLIDELYERDLTAAEVIVRDYIFKNPEEVLRLNIKELAQKTYTSSSCIVRLVQKTGMNGYNDFKCQLAKELLSLYPNEGYISTNIPIQKGDSLQEMAKKMLKLSIQRTTDTYEHLEYGLISKIVETLVTADMIVFYAVGPSLVLTQDFIFKCGRLGLPIMNSPLSGFENSFQYRKAKRPVGFIISNYANSIRLSNWIKKAKLKNFSLILLCGNEKTPFKRDVDIFLCTKTSEQRRMKIASLASELSMQYILNVIYLGIFQRNYDDNIHEIKQSHILSITDNEYIK